MTPCKTCCKLFMSPLKMLIGIGRVCEKCEEKLNRPQTLCGVVPGLSIASLAKLYHEEFGVRRWRLIEQAREVCKGVE